MAKINDNPTGIDANEHTDIYGQYPLVALRARGGVRSSRLSLSLTRIG